MNFNRLIYTIVKQIISGSKRHLVQIWKYPSSSNVPLIGHQNLATTHGSVGYGIIGSKMYCLQCSVLTIDI